MYNHGTNDWDEGDEDFIFLPPDETEYAKLMRTIFRQCGPHDAWRLLDQMIDKSDDGAYRGDLLAMARKVVASLPTIQ